MCDMKKVMETIENIAANWKQQKDNADAGSYKLAVALEAVEVIMQEIEKLEVVEEKPVE
jgi:hypothetical protein